MELTLGKNQRYPFTARHRQWTLVLLVDDNTLTISLLLKHAPPSSSAAPALLVECIRQCILYLPFHEHKSFTGLHLPSLPSPPQCILGTSSSVAQTTPYVHWSLPISIPSPVLISGLRFNATHGTSRNDPDCVLGLECQYIFIFFSQICVWSYLLHFSTIHLLSRWHSENLPSISVVNLDPTMPLYPPHSTRTAPYLHLHPSAPKHLLPQAPSLLSHCHHCLSSLPSGTAALVSHCAVLTSHLPPAHPLLSALQLE
jgi:hypothetical protein